MPAATRLHLRLTPAAERSIRAGHPWVFANSVRELNRPGRAGELAVLYDRQDRFLAIGLYDPASPIRVRVLHRGSPVQIDAAWWVQRLSDSAARRSAVASDQTTGYRMVHGESDGFPGLVIDHYGAVLVLKCYTEAWFPLLPMLREGMAGLWRPASVVLRLSRNLQAAGEAAGWREGMLLAGAPVQGPAAFLENGLTFEADVLRGQKTGFFLDQRENRAAVEKLARGRRMLNAFSFSGGFSLYAARGGAAEVVDLDISPHALEQSKAHFRMNRPAVGGTAHRCIQADAFDWLAATGERFDLVLLDPPALAKKQEEVPGALAAYRRLVRLAAARLARGGLLVACSCSAHVPPEAFFPCVEEAAGGKAGGVRVLARTGQPVDHPATFPEARYLKAIFLEAGGVTRSGGSRAKAASRRPGR